MLSPLKYALCLALVGLTHARTTNERFNEKLVLKPLQDGKVSAAFEFTTLLQDVVPRVPNTLGLEDASQHYNLFPLALGQLLREYAITELHLTLNAGNWDYDRWGYPSEVGVSTGAELWAWMGDDASTTVDQRWQGLRNGLAGLFCASLGSLGEQRTTSPASTFFPAGDLPKWSVPHQLRHASLPSERVCTENLTPFLKLLPCKSASGIASLLNPHRLFDADWHGMGVHVKWTDNVGVEVRMTFQAVFNPIRFSYHRKRDWSMQNIFKREIQQVCPVAQTSKVVVQLPAVKDYFMYPEVAASQEDQVVYDVTGPLNVGMEWRSEQAFTYPLGLPESALADFSVQRTLRGSSQARGELSVVLTNNRQHDIEISYLETMPWILQFYLHTMHIYEGATRRDELMTAMQYIPPVPHARPTTFLATIVLPANSTIHLTLDVDKAFLRYTEHPPDAVRGWDLPPAVIVPLSGSTGGVERIYTPVLLIDLATPDFSMPYNVIIFTCSVVAFIFGSVFNLLTRNFVVVKVDETTEVGDEKEKAKAAGEESNMEGSPH